MNGKYINQPLDGEAKMQLKKEIDNLTIHQNIGFGIIRFNCLSKYSFNN